MTEPTFLDGNAMAGALGEVFAVDVTAAVGRCDGCGAVAVLAEAHVFMDAPGRRGPVRRLRLGADAGGQRARAGPGWTCAACPTSSSPPPRAPDPLTRFAQPSPNNNLPR